MSIPKKTRSEKDYVSYMLRMWRDSGDEGLSSSKEAAWRASLQDPHSGERIGFAHLDELVTFLQEQISLAPRHRRPAAREELRVRESLR